MVGVHVGELAVDEQHELVLALLLAGAHVRHDDPLRLLAQARVPGHLCTTQKLANSLEWNAN